jgi:hypothetical protein
MDKHYQTLIDSIDILMIAMSKQKKLGLDPEVNDAIKKLIHARRAYKKAFNLRLATQKKLNERTANVIGSSRS